MIFKNILSLKYKPEFKLFTYLIVLSIILSLSGCATTETLRTETENITYNMNYEIVNVIMKDGKVVDLSGKSPRYAEEWDNKKNVILYTVVDTMRTSEDSISVTPVTKVIELDNVKKVTIEKSEINTEIPILVLFCFVMFFLLVGASTVSIP